MFHVGGIIICIGYMTFILLRRNLGKNVFGTCSTKADSPSVVFGPVIVSIYSIMAIFSLIYFHKYVPDSDKFR